MVGHADLPDAGRVSHFDIDRLLDGLTGETPLVGDLVLEAGYGLYFLQGTNTQKEQDGNWRLVVSGTELHLQVRDSGTWTDVAWWEP